MTARSSPACPASLIPPRRTHLVRYPSHEVRRMGEVDGEIGPSFFLSAREAPASIRHLLKKYRHHVPFNPNVSHEPGRV